MDDELERPSSSGYASPSKKRKPMARMGIRDDGRPRRGNRFVYKAPEATNEAFLFS